MVVNLGEIKTFLRQFKTENMYIVLGVLSKALILLKMWGYRSAGGARVRLIE
jgi:hypothetical protein